MHQCKVPKCYCFHIRTVTEASTCCFSSGFSGLETFTEHSRNVRQEHSHVKQIVSPAQRLKGKWPACIAGCLKVTKSSYRHRLTCYMCLIILCKICTVKITIHSFTNGPHSGTFPMNSMAHYCR